MKTPFVNDGRAAWIVRKMAAFCIDNRNQFYSHMATDAQNDDVPVPTEQDLHDLLHTQETTKATVS